ncbi:hypothetical protein STEG23_035527 [Scotinomys teguina]
MYKTAQMEGKANHKEPQLPSTVKQQEEANLGATYKQQKIANIDAFQNRSKQSIQDELARINEAPTQFTKQTSGCPAWALSMHLPAQLSHVVDQQLHPLFRPPPRNAAAGSAAASTLFTGIDQESSMPASHTDRKCSR